MDLCIRLPDLNLMFSIVNSEGHFGIILSSRRASIENSNVDRAKRNSSSGTDNTKDNSKILRFDNNE